MIFGLGFFVNFFIWGEHSSGAIPFTSMLAMGAMWFGISFPLIYIGYYVGFRKQPYQQPVRTNQIPRQVRGISGPYLGVFVFTKSLFK